MRVRERFFHWELEFPEVLLTGERPGFDVVLGNPPWDKVLPTKLEFYGRFDLLIRAYSGADADRRVRGLNRDHPELASGFEAYRDRLTTIGKVLRQGGDFPNSEARSANTNEDVSKYFVDRAFRLAREDGVAALVVPSVVYNGDGCVGIRRFLIRDATIERFYGFENRKKVLPDRLEVQVRQPCRAQAPQPRRRLHRLLHASRSDRARGRRAKALVGARHA